MKVIAKMHGNANFAKKFIMEQRKMEIDGYFVMHDGKYHLQYSGIYYEEEQYYEIDTKNKLFLREECE